MHTRRRFLKNAAAATAAGIGFPTIIPASALGADGAVAPSNRIVIACIGVGGQGTSNMGAFLQNPKAQVIAVCDVDRARAEKAKSLVDGRYENTDCSIDEDFRALIGRTDIDAVSIGTPDHWHCIPVLAAAKAKKHMYCEKPLGITVAEGRAMVDAVHASGVVFQAGTWRRSRPACRKACELVRNGYIGELKEMRIGLPEGYAIRGEFAEGHPETPVPEGFNYDFWLGPAPDKPYTPGRCHFNFRWIMDYSEGYISDWGAHYYDIAQWANGSDGSGPVRIEGTAEFPQSGLYDAPVKSDIRFTYANGVVMKSIQTLDQSQWGMHFIGTEGEIKVEANSLESTIEGLPDIELKETDIRLYASDDHHDDFLTRAANGETATAAPVAIAHSSAAVCHIGMIACLRNKPLDWDPKAERFPNDDDANNLLARPQREPWTWEV